MNETLDEWNELRKFITDTFETKFQLVVRQIYVWEWIMA